MMIDQFMAGNQWWQRRRQRGTGGFSLLMTLMAMLVGYLLVGALLVLTLSSATIGNNQLTRAKQWRGADGAMDAAINKIVQDPTGATGSFNASECKPVQTMDISGIDVTVKCRSEASELPFVPVAPPLGSNVEPKTVRVVGERYQGEPADLPTAPKSWKELPSTCSVGDSCFPWAEAFAQRPPSDYSASGALNSPEATVRHTGGEQLQIIGDVMVREGAVAARNGRIGSPATLSNRGPGIAVRGEFSQGDPGLLSSRTGAVPDVPAYEQQCGVLSPKLTTWDVKNTQVLALGGLRCSDTVTSTSRPDVAGNLTPAHPTVPRVSRRRPPPQTAPSCGGGRVVVFQPGSYDRTQTRTLNGYFSRGTCDNKVFHFLPGDYWFDVDDTNPVVPLDTPLWRNELRIDDPSSIIVFGTPTGGNAAALTAQTSAAGTALCDSNAPGVTITLSPRTSIRHDAGRVGICAGNTRTVAIQQDHAVNLGWESAPTNVRGGTRFICVNSLTLFGWTVPACAGYQWFANTVINWVAGIFGGSFAWENGTQFSGLPATNTLVNCGGRADDLLALCFAETGIAMSGWDSGGDTIGAPIDSAQVVVESDAVNSNGGGSRTRIDVVLQGASSPLCSVTYPRQNDGSNVASYELITTDPSLATPGIPLCGALGPSGVPLLNDRLQLYTASIGMVIVSDLAQDLFAGVTIFSDYGPRITNVRLRTGFSPTASAPTLSGPNATVIPGQTGAVQVQCRQFWGTHYFLGFIPIQRPLAPECPTSGSGQFTVSNLLGADTFYNTSAGSDSNTKLTSLGVVVGGTTFGPYGASAGGNSVTLSVLRPNGSVVCSNNYPGLPTGMNGRESRYLSLMNVNTSNPAVGSGSCPSALANYRVSDLVGSSIAVRIGIAITDWEYFQCVANIAGGAGEVWEFLFSWIANTNKCSGYGYVVNRLEAKATFGDCDSVTAACSTTPKNAYDGPTTPVSVTSNNQPLFGGGLNQADATFNVYGAVSIPRDDLDVTWAGSFTDDPIVKGNLWVNGIGSSSRVDSRPGATPPKVGTLCCDSGKPSERIVVLEAWVGDTLRGVARVRISDTNVALVNAGGDLSTLDPSALLDETWKPGVSTFVDYWQLCSNQPDPNPNDAGSDRCVRT